MSGYLDDGKAALPDFRQGDSVILVDGTYTGTPGTFLCYREDPKWASIAERSGITREHPVAWLRHRAESPDTVVAVGEELRNLPLEMGDVKVARL